MHGAHAHKGYVVASSGVAIALRALAAPPPPNQRGVTRPDLANWCDTNGHDVYSYVTTLSLSVGVESIGDRPSYRYSVIGVHHPV